MRLLAVACIFICTIMTLTAAAAPLSESSLPTRPTSEKASAVGTVLKGIGPFKIESADSQSVLQFQLVAQLRLQFESLDRGSGNDRTHDLFMELRRLRPVLSLTLRKPDVSFRVHLSTAPRSLELMDCQVECRLRSRLQLRMGQYKAPFTRYRIQSFQRLTFADWSLSTRWFGAERQMGLAAHNGYENPPRWGYILAVMTGVNARASHAVGLPKLYGETTPNPSDLTQLNPPAKFHPEVFLHLSHGAGGIKVDSDADAEGGGLRYSLAASAAWDFAPVLYYDYQLRLSPEMLLKYGGFSCSVFGYAAWSRFDEPRKLRLATTGAQVQFARRLGKRLEIAARYAIADPTDELSDDAYQHGQKLIADALQSLEEADEKELAQQEYDAVKSQYKSAGTTMREEEFTLGVNVYLIGHSLKWQNDAGLIKKTLRDDIRQDVIIRSQYQVAF